MIFNRVVIVSLHLVKQIYSKCNNSIFSFLRFCGLEIHEMCSLENDKVFIILILIIGI